MQIWKRTKLLQMLGVTIIGSHSHVGSQVLGGIRHCFVDVYLWQLFPVSTATFNSSVVLAFGWSLRYFSSMALQIFYSSGFKSEELERHSVFSVNPFAFSQSCITLEH